MTLRRRLVLRSSSMLILTAYIRLRDERQRSDLWFKRGLESDGEAGD
jgi:hypothetical protein